MSEALIVLDHDLEHELNLFVPAKFDFCRSFLLLFHNCATFLLFKREFGLVQVSKGVFCVIGDVNVSYTDAFAVVTCIFTASFELDQSGVIKSAVVYDCSRSVVCNFFVVDFLIIDCFFIF